MRIVKYEIRRYNLPFVSEVVVADETLTRKSGAHVILTDDSGISGSGDVAPLAGYSIESLQQAIDDILGLCELCKDREIPAEAADMA